MKAPEGWKPLLDTFGNPSWQELSGGNVSMDPAWESNNLVVLAKPCGLAIPVRCHHLVVAPFLAALGAALKAAPQYVVKQLGGYCPRHQRHDPRLPLSIHSYGAAFDFNWDQNPMGPTLVTDLPSAFVSAFTTNGFEWGGSWRSIKDSMHFQFAHGV